MQEIKDNEQKYNNYKEQMGRLNKAMKAGFFLEALFIEGAVIEDRIESFLRHSNVFNPEKHNTLNRKLSKLSEQQRSKKGLVRRYISDELLESVYLWKKKRNTLVHALLKQDISSEDLFDAADEGRGIARALCNKATSFRRMIEGREGKA